MPTHAPHRPQLPPWLVLATCLGACVGTPTPEPPDNLPRPEPDKIFGVPYLDTVSHETLPPVDIVGLPGAVQPDAELWIVNLDRDDPPQRTRARGDGSFAAEVGGEQGDRVRLVVRTDGQHSLPLDGEVVSPAPDSLALAGLRPRELACLRIEPADELIQVLSGSNVTRHVALHNECTRSITVDRAALRFGDAGFTLKSPQATIAAGTTAELELNIRAHDDRREHADILLLDVSSGTESGRYALGIWSVASSSIGND